MDRGKFKTAIMPVLEKETFVTPSGTDYTEFIADQLFNAIEDELKIITSNLPVMQSLSSEAVAFNYWVAMQGFRFIESGNLYYWRSEKLDKNIKTGDELYQMYKERGNVA